MRLSLATVVFFVSFSFLSILIQAFADDPAPPTVSGCVRRMGTRHGDPGMAGIGLLLGKSLDTSNSASHYAVVLAAEGIFNPMDPGAQPEPACQISVFQYGHRHSKFELGTGFGFHFESTGGAELLSSPTSQSFTLAPHLGIELGNLRFSLNTRATRENFFEWSPMVSLGAQLYKLTEDCSFLALGRGGFSVGTLAHGGIRPALGGAGSLSCKQVGLSLEYLRILSHLSGDSFIAELPSLSLILKMPNPDVSIALRGESLLKQFPPGTQTKGPERRALLVIGRAI